MKQKTLGLLACTALLCACQPAQKQTTITGTLTGVESDTLIVAYCPLADLNQRAMQKDTILLQQGKFTLPLANDSTPTAAYLYPLSAGKLTKSIRDCASERFGRAIQLYTDRKRVSCSLANRKRSVPPLYATDGLHL